MHNRFDRFIKRLVRKGVSPGGLMETDAEVSPDAQRIDVWFTPDPARARKVLAPLGLLGRICRKACTLEPFHRTASGAQVADCTAKHRFFCRELARRKPRPPPPMQWVISSGRPSEALSGLAFRKSRLGKGIYEAPVLLRTRLVVVSELPRTRDTLLVRLMGAGNTLRRAIADTCALPPDAVERRLVMPILVRSRLEVPADPAKQTRSDREFLMRAQEVERYLGRLEREALQRGMQKGMQQGVQKGMQQGVQKGMQQGMQKGMQQGVRQGMQQGFAKAVLEAYRARFGAPPAALVTAVESAKDSAALQRWLEIVTTRSEEQVAAKLRAPRKTMPSRRTAPRRGTSQRRAPAAE